MRYFIITYGCQMNKSDSERIAAVLENKGYKEASKIDEADLIVVNMCSVRQSAVDRVYGKLNQISKTCPVAKRSSCYGVKNPRRIPSSRGGDLRGRQNENSKCKIILTGCILTKDKEKLKEKVDLILNIKDLPNWPKFLESKSAELSSEQKSYANCEYLKIQPKYQYKPIAYIPISTGCNDFCSYCAVPFTRGRLVCRPAEDILEEVKNAVKNGFKEIWLLGQNVNGYQSRIDTNMTTNFTNNIRDISAEISANSREVNFAKLLKMVNDIPGDFWIRFTSPHPKNFSDELIETMAKCQKVTPHLNLPLQSGDDEILKRMKRPYTIRQYQNLVKKIRQAFKKYRKGIEREIAISTDIIVGFPGETKKQFQNTVKVFKKIKFDMAYIAKFSPRPGTLAAKMKDQVSQEEKERRWKILSEILRKIALEKNKKYIGKEVEVLVEESKDGFLIGKSRHFKTVKFKGKKELIGKFIKVKIVSATPWGLKGKIKNL